MAKYKTGFSAKERNNSEYCGFKNWDTWSVSLILRNDFRAYKFVFNNKQRLLRMSKLDKLYAIRRFFISFVLSIFVIDLFNTSVNLLFSLQ